MSKGIIRKVDELGRIVIPVEIRNKLNIQEKDEVEIILVRQETFEEFATKLIGENLFVKVSKEKYAINELEIKLLYVSMTRAMHTLDIFYEKDLTELLS